MIGTSRASWYARALSLALIAAVAHSLSPATLFAQTDFFNTDGGRPLRVQDANSVEWRALELQFAPLRVERHRGSGWRASYEPELAFGVLPRTHVAIGFPIATAEKPPRAPANFNGVRAFGVVDAVTPRFDETPGTPGAVSTGQINGLAGVHLSVFHQLNVETRIPAMAIRGEVLLPAGPLGPDRAYPSLTGIVTRTLPQFGPVRVHANATYTFGDAPDVLSTVPTGPMAEDVPRWLAGVSVDRAFPLKSTLIAMEVVARQGLVNEGEVMWSAGAGARHQFSPRLVLDVGVGRQFTGFEPHWSVTVGSAIALGLGRRLF